MTEVSGALIGGRYRLLELIGQGGMGRVWRGRDETLARDVAVKEVLLPQGVTPDQREVLLQRVAREARAAARLNHPGIITVHDVSEHQGAPVIVMEYVTGSSLAAAITREGALPVRQVARIGVTILKALGHAHASGIVHRDLKPDNVLLMDDRVILTDFGIAHMADATMALTHTGTIIGTPAYMAPEQLVGKPPAPATDLWALGATLYCAVEGEPPFTAETFTALCIAVSTQEPRTPVRAGGLAPVLAALLTKDPALRAGADHVLAALEALASTGAAAPTPVPTQMGAAAPPGFGPATAPPGFGPAPDVITADATVVPPPQPPGAAPHYPGHPLWGQPPAPAVPGAGTTASTSQARVLRFLGCLALLWIVGIALPWNSLGSVVRYGYAPAALMVTLGAAVLHAVPRPRWHPAACWITVVVVDWVLFVLLRPVVGQVMGLRHPETGFATGPGQMLVNVLILGTGAWLLWWKIPGSRQT